MNGLLVALMLAGGVAPPPPSEPPPVTLQDLARFPSQSTVHETLQFIIAHRAWLEQQHGLTFDEYYYWNARRDDMQWRWDIWDDLRLVHESTNPETKVYFLGRIREKVGTERFYLGQLPPPVPVWCFQRLDY